MLISPETDKIFAAFVAAQSEMGAVHKDGKNPHFRSTYATLESVVEAARPVLSKHGLAFTQLCGPRTDGGVTVTTTLVHSSGQYFGDALTLPMVKSDPQAAGSAITYARRYALIAILGLPATDDDAQAAMPGRDDLPPAPKAPRVQAARPEQAPEASARYESILDRARMQVRGAVTRDALDQTWEKFKAAFHEHLTTKDFMDLADEYNTLREELPASSERSAA